MPAKKPVEKEKVKKPKTKKQPDILATEPVIIVKKDDGTRPHETVEDVMEEYRELKAEEDRKQVEATVSEVLAELQEACEEDVLERAGAADEGAAGSFGGFPIVAEIPEHREPVESGLLARFPDGSLREPTHEELLAMGRQLADRLFGRIPPNVEAVLDPGAPPKPKISGNHCRLCKSFAGDDPRGSLWSTKGLCLTFKHVQNEVEPEYVCERFIFNEGLRDNA